MKVTKGQVKEQDRKVIAFYANGELVFRDKSSDKNFVLSNNAVHKGSIVFDEYLSMSQTTPGFIAFYEGDTIIIELWDIQ